MVIGFKDGEKLRRSELEVIGQSFLLKCLLKLREEGLVQEEGREGGEQAPAGPEDPCIPAGREAEESLV